MNQRTHTVIVGGGFGGLNAARALRNVDTDVTLIDKRNFHLFQPLLYQVATGGLSPANIAAPLRRVFKRQRNVRILLGEVRGFDTDSQTVKLDHGELHYDHLILAAGSVTSYFGNDSWGENAVGLKSIEDATRIRHDLLNAFETAERESDPNIRERLLTFVIVGGGPTGVEMVGAISELARNTLSHEFRHVDTTKARVLLVERDDRVLTPFPTELSAKTAEALKNLNVEVRTGYTVLDIRDDHVTLQPTNSDDPPERVDTQNVIWAAGVEASPLGKQLAQAANVDCDNMGRIPVEPDLSVPGHPELFVIGDLANCPGEDGAPLPGLAPVAVQQGKYLGHAIRSRIQNNDATPFRYDDQGIMTVIGRSKAVARLGRFKISGFPAWIIWLIVHLMQLVSFQNRTLVFIQWGWNYLTWNRAARLITEAPAPKNNPKP